MDLDTVVGKTESGYKQSLQDIWGHISLMTRDRVSQCSVQVVDKD